MQLSDINNGVCFVKGHREKEKCFCKCGHIFEQNYFDNTVCPKCNNRNFIRLDSIYENKELGGYSAKSSVVKTISKDDSGFSIEKEDIVFTVNEKDNNTQLELNEVSTGYTIDFSFKTKEMIIKKHGKILEYNIHDKTNKLSRLLEDISRTQLLDAISTEKTRELYDLSFEKLGKKGLELKYMRIRGLYRLITAYDYLQIFALYGFNKNQLSNVFYVAVDKKETQVPKMLNIPKFILDELLRNNISITFSTLQTCRDLLNKFDANTIKEIFKIFYEESNLDDFFSSSYDYIMTN